MLTVSEDGRCVVQVTPVTYEGDGDGNWWDESRVSDLLAMYKNGAWVYQVRPGVGYGGVAQDVQSLSQTFAP